VIFSNRADLGSHVASIKVIFVESVKCETGGHANILFSSRFCGDSEKLKLDTWNSCGYTS
jgi:hypothetical protein